MRDENMELGDENMELELVGEEDLHKKMRQKTKNKRYDDALEKHLSWIKEKIKQSKDGRIIIRTKELAKQLGPDFAGYSIATIYLSVKLSLWKKDIFVETGKHKKDNDDLLILRVKDEYDVLPARLKRELEEEERDELKEEDELELKEGKVKEDDEPEAKLGDIR